MVAPRSLSSPLPKKRKARHVRGLSQLPAGQLPSSSHQPTQSLPAAAWPGLRDSCHLSRPHSAMAAEPYLREQRGIPPATNKVFLRAETSPECCLTVCAAAACGTRRGWMILPVALRTAGRVKSLPRKEVVNPNKACLGTRQGVADQ